MKTKPKMYQVTQLTQIRDNTWAIYGNPASPLDGAITRQIVAWGIVEMDDNEQVACGLVAQEENAALIPALAFDDFIAYGDIHSMAHDWNKRAIAWTKAKYPQAQEEDK